MAEVVDSIMAELERTPFDDETWAAKFTVMKENLEHHIEEEGDEMYKQLRQVMDERDLSELGERMAARKEELQSSIRDERMNGSTPTSGEIYHEQQRPGQPRRRSSLRNETERSSSFSSPPVRSWSMA